jgi:hypothetical protein
MSFGDVVVLRLGFFAGAGASSSDFRVSVTFSAMVFFVGDRELPLKRL